MKILIVNTNERTGGAAVAAGRLADALNDNGVKARRMVREKLSTDITVATCGSSLRKRLAFLWERLVIWLNNGFSRERLFKVSIANAGVDITHTPEFQEADIIHLHWINQGMLSLGGIRKILQSGKPVVWTMHDMWEATAICHHAYDCQRYAEECGQCPFLGSHSDGDLSHRVFRRKQQMLDGAQRLTFVAVSRWLAEKARASALIGHFPIRVIPNVLSLQQFTIIDRIDARTALDADVPYVIAFGAARIDDPIKGFSYLADALRLLVDSRRFRAEDIRLLLFGEVRDASIFSTLPVGYSYLGYVDDAYRLSQVYSAANATVSSSLYETFGQTLIEAMACGSTPVSFDGSGQADIISHQQNGYLARRLSVESLAEGIAWALTTPLDAHSLRRSVIRRYAESVVAQQYTNLYNDIMK